MSWYECSLDVLRRGKETYEILTSRVNLDVNVKVVLGRRLRPHIGNCFHIPQRFVVSLELIFASSYIVDYLTNVHIDLRE